MVSVLVTHERNRWSATEVVIEGSVSEGASVLEFRAREHLRKHAYGTYLSVTEHPLLPDRDENYEANMALYRRSRGIKTYKPGGRMDRRFES